MLTEQQQSHCVGGGNASVTFVMLHHTPKNGAAINRAVAST